MWTMRERSSATRAAVACAVYNVSIDGQPLNYPGGHGWAAGSGLCVALQVLPLRREVCVSSCQLLRLVQPVLGFCSPAPAIPLELVEQASVLPLAVDELQSQLSG